MSIKPAAIEATVASALNAVVNPARSKRDRDDSAAVLERELEALQTTVNRALRRVVAERLARPVFERTLIFILSGDCPPEIQLPGLDTANEQHVAALRALPQLVEFVDCRRVDQSGTSSGIGEIVVAGTLRVATMTSFDEHMSYPAVVKASSVDTHVSFHPDTGPRLTGPTAVTLADHTSASRSNGSAIDAAIGLLPEHCVVHCLPPRCVRTLLLLASCVAPAWDYYHEIEPGSDYAARFGANEAFALVRAATLA